MYSYIARRFAFGALTVIGVSIMVFVVMRILPGDPLVAIFGMIVAMVAAPLIQMAISRSREYIADEAGARLTDDPLALASALRKIAAWSQQIPIHSGNPETAHLFIVNPFSGGGITKLFSTHPSTEDRVARLETLARGGAPQSARPILT